MIGEDPNNVHSKVPKSILKKNSQFDQDSKGETEFLPRLKSVKSIRFCLDVNKRAGNWLTGANKEQQKGKSNKGRKEKLKRQRHDSAEAVRGIRAMARKKPDTSGSPSQGGDGPVSSRPGSPVRAEKDSPKSTGVAEEKEKKLWQECRGEPREDEGGASSGLPGEEVKSERGKSGNAKAKSPGRGLPVAKAVNEEEEKEETVCKEEGEKRECKKKRRRRKRKRRREAKE